MRIIPDALIYTIRARRLIGTTNWQSDYLNVIATTGEPITFTLDGQQFSAPACAFRSSDPVTLSVQHETHALVLLLHPEGVLDLTGDPSTMCTPLYQFGNRPGVLYSELIRLMRLVQQNEAGNSMAKSACILNLLQTLRDNAPNNENVPAPLVPLTAHRFALYRSIYSYVDFHYADGISQADTAAVFNITPQYLARFLRENLNMTFRELLADRRQAKADAYRQYTTLTEEEIAWHISPEYRSRDYHQAADVILPGIADTTFSALRVTSPQPADVAMRPDRQYVTASLNMRHITTSNWRRLINIGYAANLRELDLDAMLARIQQDIHFQYARICRITDIVYSYAAEGSVYYDFSHVFLLLDTLRKYDLIPFLEISNKRFVIQQATRQPITPRSSEPSVEYYKNLEILLPHLLEACINYYGQSVVDTWYIEISYPLIENGDPQNPDKDYDLRKYTREFKRLYHMIRKYSKGCRIGGPGFNDWGRLDHITEYLHMFRRMSITPDYYSVYAYPIVDAPDGSGPVLSSDRTLLRDRLQTFATQVHATEPDKEVWVTEFNSNLSSQNYLNDSCYQATFLLDLVRQTAPLHLHALGYYLLSDAPLRYSDSLDFLFGGWGLMTDNNVPKPSYHAYHAMAMLGYYHIKSTDECTITADSYGHFQILLHRFSPLLPQYCEHNLTRQDLSSESALIRRSGTDRYHIEIHDVQPGNYIIEDYQINQGHANLAKCWQQMNYLLPSGSAIIREIARISDLLPQIYSCSVESDRTFTFDVALHDLDIHMIVVTLCENILPDTLETSYEEQ